MKGVRIMVSRFVDPPMPNKPAENCGIEITDEMIEAGEDAVWSGIIGGELPADFSARDLAISVYLAMLRQRREK